MGKNLLLTNLADNYYFGNTKELMIDEINKLFSHCASTGRLIDEVLFIAYAFDGGDWNSYINNVKDLFPDQQFRLINEFSNPVEAIGNAQAVCVGGGNLNYLKNSVSDVMFDKLNTRIENGMPYIGWNEGAVLACPTHIDDLNASEIFIDLVPFQIFCHFKMNLANETKIRAFLIGNSDRILPIVQVVCFSDSTTVNSFQKIPEKDVVQDTDKKADAEEEGSGIRIEESNAGLAGTESAPAVIIYQLVDGNLFSFPLDPNNVAIM